MQLVATVIFQLTKKLSFLSSLIAQGRLSKGLQILAYAGRLAFS